MTWLPTAAPVAGSSWSSCQQSSCNCCYPSTFSRKLLCPAKPCHVEHAVFRSSSGKLPSHSACVISMWRYHRSNFAVTMIMMAVIVWIMHSVLQNFARTAVTAYECGYSEDTLRQELEQATAQQSTPDSVKVPLYWRRPLVSLPYSYIPYLL